MGRATAPLANALTDMHTQINQEDSIPTIIRGKVIEHCTENFGASIVPDLVVLVKLGGMCFNFN